MPPLFVWVFLMGVNVLTLPIVTNIEAPAVQDELRSMNITQRQQFVDYLVMYNSHGWASMPLVSQFFFLILVGLGLLALDRVFLKRGLTLRQALIIKAYASVVSIPESLVRAVVVLQHERPTVYLGPAMLLANDGETSYVDRVLMGMNVFEIWQLWVIALGLQVLTGVKFARTGLLITTIWLVWIAGGAAVDTLGELVPTISASH